MEAQFPGAPEEEKVRRLTELNVQTQLDNLRRHPSITARLSTGGLGLHGWIYEIETGRVLALNEQTGEFRLWPE